MLFFFFKQKTAYEMRISDGSPDVCSSDLPVRAAGLAHPQAGRADARPATRRLGPHLAPHRRATRPEDRKSVVSGKSVSVRVDIGGRRILKNQKKQQLQNVR